MPKDAKGHGSNPRGIKRVHSISYSNEAGGFRRWATVEHEDHSGRRSRTSGVEDNLHMGELIKRGLREGASVSGGEPASGHAKDAAAQLREGSTKSSPVPTHSAMAGSSADTHRRVSEAEGAMSRLRTTFHQGNNKHGEYGRNTREAFDRHAKLHAELTGKPKRNIYD